MSDTVNRLEDAPFLELLTLVETGRADEALAILDTAQTASSDGPLRRSSPRWVDVTRMQ